jgi:polyisoprenoid-binding protein YceI
MRKIALAAAALMLAACASAQTVPAQAPVSPTGSPVPAAIAASSDTSLDPATAPAGAYTMDSRHASVVWRIRHLGLSLFTARFDSVNGTLNWNPTDPAASALNVTIAANSVSTGVLNPQGQRAFDNTISTDVLGSAANPNITFVSRSITGSGTSGLITGDLTLNGVTKPVTLEATFEGHRFVALRQKHVLAFAGRTIIKRSEFNAGFDNAIVNGTVGDDVEIIIQVEFVKD